MIETCKWFKTFHPVLLFYDIYIFPLDRVCKCNNNWTVKVLNKHNGRSDLHCHLWAPPQLLPPGKFKWFQPFVATWYLFFLLQPPKKQNQYLYSQDQFSTIVQQREAVNIASHSHCPCDVLQTVAGIIIGKSDVKSFPDRKSKSPF